jgi:DNA-binding transcriptional LysR family regulator
VYRDAVNWDDLRYLVAVAESGSLTAAARALKMEAKELERRINALESELNCELLDGTPDRFAVTASGQRAVTVAKGIAAQIVALAAEVGGDKGEVRGRVSVTSTAGFMPRAIKAFEPLRDKYPALKIDVMVSSHVVDLRRKEADIAVRMFRDTAEGIGMKKLGVMGWSLYASPKYLAGRTAGPGVDGHEVIGYDDGFKNTAGGRWIAANVPEQSVVMRVGGIRQALDAAMDNHGVCVVPCHLASERAVKRVTDQVVATNEVYAVYLAERSTEARLQVVVDALLDLFAREQSTFGGEVATGS